jgi:catechol 2,3-dioxygenase-like lactoylglutathione lyase family enzyme
MFIPVHDPDAALGFYRDALGLDVRMDVSSARDCAFRDPSGNLVRIAQA